MQKKVQLVGAASGSLLLGDSRYGYAAKLTTGVGLGKCRLEAGAAYDHYYFRSYPLFASVSYDALKRWRLTAELGVNLPEQRALSQSSWSITRLENGYYHAGFIQYRLQNWKQKALYAGLGYSKKSLQTIEQVSGGWPYKNERTYELSRLAAQFSFSF